jgi:uncharacterized Zn finger protein
MAERTPEDRRVLTAVLETLREQEHIASSTAARKRRFLHSDHMHAGLVVEVNEEISYFDALAHRYDQLTKEIMANSLFDRLDAEGGA